jgi:excinuclease ABC subunit B
MSTFSLSSLYQPKGDQAQAIAKLTKSIEAGNPASDAAGGDGLGEDIHTAANVIRNVEKPTLVISHNKTLAAQLYSEFKQFFPESAVEYFVSYFDYYQPEAYIPRTDTYIEKDSSINEEIERLRLSTTSSLLSRKDVIVIASVSCIYGLGSPEDYMNMLLTLKLGQQITREAALTKLVTCSMSAMTWPLSADASACAATWWRCIRRTWMTRRSAWSSSAMRLIG